MDFKKVEERNAEIVEWMKKDHSDYVRALESSPLSKVQSITAHEIANLGKQFIQFEMYKKMCEDSSGSLSALGQLPKIALDVITATMGNSVLPLIASVQPIEEQKGIVYFRQIKSKDTRGSQTAGDVVTDPRKPAVTPSGYASNELSGELVVANTVALQTAYTFTLAKFPILSQFLKISFSNNADIVAVDQGAIGSDKNIGILFGKGLSGEVNYTTGVVTIEFANDPGAGFQIYAKYQQDLERGEDLQAISSFIDSTEISAKVYALKQSQGMLQSFTLQKRFGMQMREQLAADLVMEVNKEIGGDAIRSLKVSAQGTTTFSRTLPTGVSFAEHKLFYKDQLFVADNVIVGNAGRGQISTLIVGKKHAAFLRGLPGFELMNDGNTLGSHLFGKLDGITVIRVPEIALMAEDDGIGLYKGQNPYEAACVYSPFMPMAVTDMLPEGKNPLNGQRAAATMAGVAALVPQYATKMNIIP